MYKSIIYLIEGFKYASNTFTCKKNIKKLLKSLDFLKESSIMKLPHELNNNYAHIIGEVYLFTFGKNVCSISYALPFYVRVISNSICVVAIGVIHFFSA